MSISIGLGIGLNDQIGAAGGYVINGVEMDYVLDFNGNVAYVNGVAANLNNAVTYGGGGLRTCYNASGDLVWNAHNLLVWSEDLTNAAWTKTNCSVSGNTVTSTTTNSAQVRQNGRVNQAGTYQLISRLTQGTSEWVCVYISDGGANYSAAWIDMSTGTLGSTTAVGAGWTVSSSLVDLGGGTYELTLNVGKPATLDSVVAPCLVSNANSSFNNTLGTTATLDRAQTRRFELGVLTNPDNGTDYVMTEASPVYKWRANGYHYDNAGTLRGPTLVWDSGAATNLALQSEDLSSGSWQKLNVTLSAKDADGYFTATPTGAGSFSELGQNPAATITGSTYYTVRVDVRANGAPWAYLQLNSAGGTFRATAVFIDLSTGAATISNLSGGGFSNGQAYAVERGAGEYSISLTVQTDAGHTGLQMYYGVASALNVKSTTLAHTGDFRRPQMETGQVSTSYIPTAAATITRAAETLTVTAADLPYNSTNMSITLAGRINRALGLAETPILLWGAAGDLIQYGINASNNWVIEQEESSVLDSETITGAPDRANDPFKVAGRHGSTFIQVAADGAAETENATPTALPNLAAVDMGLLGSFYGGLDLFTMADEDFGSAGLVEATT